MVEAKEANDGHHEGLPLRGPHDDKPHLVLISDTYPFGKGEKTFLAPEVEALSHSFRVTLVTQVSKELRLAHEDISELPSGVELVVITSPTILDYLLAVPSMFFSSLMRKEMRDLVSDGFSTLKLIDSVKHFLCAKAFWRACRGKGLFNDADTAIYYSFWYSYRLLSLCMETPYAPGMVIVGRVNGFDLYNERNPCGRQPFQRVKRDGCKRVLFGALAAECYFTETFGPEKSHGQYVLNRLGVSGGCYECNPPSREPFIIVSCSNVVPLKRVDLIAEALYRLSNPRVRWVHFGDGPELAYVQSLAEEYRLNCWLPGSAPNEEVLSFYRNNRVGCFIALSETEGGCPVSLQEALSFGIPAIVTEAGGAHYEGVDTNGIRLSNKPSVNDVAKAIDTVYQLEDDDWLEMSSRSYELWEHFFSSDACKAELVEVLNSLK